MIIMASEQLIPAVTFCTLYNIDLSFIQSLEEQQLLELTTIDGDTFLHEEQLPEAETLVRLHRDLHINVEGIDAIKNLLCQLQQVNEQMSSLRNRLRLYESL